jgi:hypothetical protein
MINVIMKRQASLKSPCLHPVFGPVFTPLSPLSVVSAKSVYFIKSQNEMLKLSISCTRFETNYSSCTRRSSENICSSSVGAQEKGKNRMKLSLPSK